MKTETLNTILEDIPEDKRKDVIDKIFAENGKDVNAAKDAAKEEADKLTEQIAERDKQIGELSKNPEATDALKTQIADLQKANKEASDALEAEKAKYAAEIADRDFATLLDGKITDAGAKSAKAVKAFLDMESLKKSKNQQADIEAAIEKAKTDNDYLFQSSEPAVNPVAKAKQQVAVKTDDSAMRAVYGLPPDTKGD